MCVHKLTMHTHMHRQPEYIMPSAPDGGTGVKILACHKGSIKDSLHKCYDS